MARESRNPRRFAQRSPRTVELTELLQFAKEWLTTDNKAKASFAQFAGTPATKQPISAPT
jgi:hypothetical protein